MTTTGSGMRVTSAGNGATTSFAVPFAFLADADLKVYLLDSATQDSATGTLQILGTNYTITGDKRAATASVVMTVAPITGKFLRRERVTSRSQTADLVPGTPPPAATIEDALDRGAMVSEEIADSVGRAVLVPPGEASVTLPTSAARLGKFLFFNLTTGLPEAVTPSQPAFTFDPVVTGAAGSNGSLAVTGAFPNYVLTFTVPRGATGASGALSDGTFGGIVVTGGGTSLNVIAGHITFARMANLAANSFILNNTGSAAVPIAGTGTQATALLDLATTALKGLAPARPASNATRNWLRGDNAYAQQVDVIPVACSDETTALTAGVAKVTFRMPYAMTLTAVRASLTTAQATNGAGSIFTVDIKESGVSILSTKLTIDNTEKTSTTAVTAPVISDAALADDAEMTVDISLIGDGTAKGLKIYLIGTIA